MKKFRKHKKEGLEFQIPPDVAELIRLRAARERRSLSEVGTHLLLIGLGLDLAEYGIEPEPAQSA